MSFSNSGWCVVQRGVLTQQLTHHVHTWGATWYPAFQLRTHAGLQRCALTLQAPPGYACSLGTVLCKEAITLLGGHCVKSPHWQVLCPPHQLCRECTTCYPQDAAPGPPRQCLQPGSANCVTSWALRGQTHRATDEMGSSNPKTLAVFSSR